MTDVCGCCEPATPFTPLAVDNRPGLSAIAYRVGAYAGFVETMLQSIARSPELAGLTTRQTDDYAVTILSLWAAVADVLTFYQERYANEAYLGTAQLRESIGRLTRLIDYQLGPGVAALARLAFTVDAGKTLRVPAGLRVQSVPGQDQQPQVFEAIEPLAADARLNRPRIYPRPAAPGPLPTGQTQATLDRTRGPALAAALAPGDHVLIFNNGATDAIEEKEVAALTRQDDRILARWRDAIQGTTWATSSLVYRFKRTFRLFGYNAPSSYVQPATDATVPGGIKWTLTPLSDADYTYPGGTALALDGRYPNLAAGTPLLVGVKNGPKTLVTITAVDQSPASFGSLGDTTTTLTVDQSLPAADRRAVTIFELAEPLLTFWDGAYAPTLDGSSVYLPGWATVDAAGRVGVEVGRTIQRNDFKPGVILFLDEIPVGRAVILTDAAGTTAAGKIASVPTTEPAINPTRTTPGEQFCHLTFSLDLESAPTLDAASAVLLGNVCLASHGETVRNEVVGSGDASARFQRLPLKKKPLTYVPSNGAGGVSSTLQVMVNDVRWDAVSGLYGAAPTAPVYAVRTADDGATVLQFGDGTTGAVLPSGQSNVKATYRVGVGLAGRVGANALTTAMDRPVGLSAVTNPLAAGGGADPESMAQARQNAPRTVRTFGRAVSLRDLEDLVTASGEVAKAQATWVWDGLDRLIFLTIAGQQGGSFAEADLQRLGDALTAARDPNHRLRLGDYLPVALTLGATVLVDPSRGRNTVIAAARAALLEAMSFDQRRLGQPVHLSDVYRVLQDVPGVTAVDVGTLRFKRPAGLSDSDFAAYLDGRGVSRRPDGAPDPVQGHLRIYPSRPDPIRPGGVRPAELAWVEAPARDVTITGTGGWADE